MGKKLSFIGIITLVLTVLAGAGGPGVPSARAFDILAAYDKLAANRRVYNAYNDSIRHLSDRQGWVDLFMRRSAINTAMYRENGRLLDSLRAIMGDQRDLPALADTTIYSLYWGLLNMTKTDASDPFLAALLAKRLLPHVQRNTPLDTIKLAHLYGIIAVNEYQNSMVYAAGAGDTAWHAYNKIMALAPGLVGAHRGPVVAALTGMITPQWIRLGRMTPERSFRLRDSLIAEIDAMEGTRWMPIEQVRKARKALRDYDDGLIRNMYLADPKTLPLAVGDSLMEAIMARGDAHPELLDLKGYSVYQLVRDWHGRITPEEALEAIEADVNARWRPRGTIKSTDVRLLYSVVLDMIYLNDQATALTETQKHDNAYRYCQLLLTALQMAHDSQSDHILVEPVRQILGYRRLNRYLSREERRRLMTLLMMRTQVSTLAHSEHVGAMARILMEGLRRYRPDLLPPAGTNAGMSWPDFAYHCAYYHDIGKNFIIPVVANNYRPLMPREMEIMRTHAQLGANLLQNFPMLAPFADVAWGHHRWHDGRGGYPQEYRPEPSPVQIVVDMVEICDCLEAGTDPVGRNYSPNKHFDLLMGEFEQQRGTKFNADLLDLIRDHPDVAERLRYSVEVGWQDIYYDIYEQFEY